ncbi:MAG: AbrB/MazE/SpoVT family DNA-binding domain-containing protein [Desulfobacteraceae bacterium]|nr:MAG: AbrB/MazE/SpoVT family DNA-binding domain-containing protein [Desulfobacteraceae bacterium]
MTIATLTTKGQVTIPKAVRDSMRINAGDRIEFIITEGGEALIRPITKKVDDVFGRLYKTGRKPVSVEQMDVKIRQRILEIYK